MSFETRDRGAYLLGLRERAVERMRADEAEVKPVSRRESLRWLGLGAAAAVAAKPMRAMEAAGVLRERSEAAGSMRYPAPQYGVPALPGPSVPFEIEEDRVPKSGWGGSIQIAKSREELSDAKLWARDYVLFFPDEAVKHQFSDGKGIDAKVILYRPDKTSKAHALEVVANHVSNKTYVIAGGQQLYTEDASGLWSFDMGDKALTVRRSLLHVSGSDDNSMDRAIHELAKKAADSQLKSDAGMFAEIDISEVRPSRSNGNLIYSANVCDGQVTIRPYYGRGPFTVDWKKKKLIPSVNP